MKKRTLRTGLAAGALALGMLLAACGGPTGTSSSTSSEAPAGDEAVTIGSMIWNTSVPFYSNFIKAQEDTAAEMGAKLTIVDGKGDIGTEVAGVQQLIAQEVDVILVTPSDAKGIAPAVKKANEAGIPVFAVNNRVDTESADVVTFVGADDVEFGRQQAKLLGQALPDGGKVAYMMGALGTSAQLLRKEGFDEGIKEFPNITIVEEQTTEWDAAKAVSLTQVWLGKYAAGQLDAVVSQGPEAANSAKYAQESGRSDVKFIVGDYPADVRQGIKDGYILGTVNQDPAIQGVRSIEDAIAWAQGNESDVPQPNDYLELPIVTADNVEEYAAAWGE
ncbi:MAG: sugar ABC transporter substrate-binding protein [Propioniciclava sp.]